MNLSNLKSASTSVLLIALIIAITRGGNFEILQNLIAPIVFVIVVFNLDLSYLYKSGASKITSIYVLGLMLSALVSVILFDHNIVNIMRAFVIYVLLQLACYFDYKKTDFKLLFIPVLVQCLLIVSISIAMTVAGGSLDSVVRTIAKDSSWGDIFTQNGYYYKVQVLGNSTIIMFFLIAMFHAELKNRSFFLLILGSALIAAGNLTYLISAGLSVIIKFLKKRGVKEYLYRIAFLIIIVVLLLIYIGGEIYETFSAKFDTGASSMGIRFDQFNAYWSSVCENPSVLLLGNGIGAPFPNGLYRDYSQFNYIELMSLKFLYEVGVIGLIVYAAGIILALRNRVNKNGILVFILYLVASFTNPYIFDSNQILMTILCIVFFPKKYVLNKF